MTKKSKARSVSQRLEFIEFTVYWQGQINRADLIEKFKISVPQASHDISQYDELYPENVVYDSRLKAYVAGPSFEPRLYTPSARRYLADLRAVQERSLDRGNVWHGWTPEVAVVPVPRRSLRAEKLQRVLAAIRQKQALKVRYQSFASDNPDGIDEPTDRWITPHAIASDGTRWHIRAWCHRRAEFRDFLFVRIRAFLGAADHLVVSDVDVWWREQLCLRLAPNPELPQAQRKVLEADFGMKGGVCETSMRACLTYYFEKNLLLDKGAEVLPAARRQVVLVNREELNVAKKALWAEAERLNATVAPLREAVTSSSGSQL